ncbi:MAG: tRNA (N6-threonylcarbamoyladenosine(37)-N6)-methyltransferase TrmO [Candidatus Heimdallarchaeota archaeon]|nr:tRNA (N6-threonylcarbamoyladenosine(37)-N6)-methyltransferase TrmO [Candidatus Heimdallarchaeota archaeon]
MNQIQEIGIIQSKFKEPTDPFKMKEEESIIEIFDEYKEGLYRIEENEYIQVVFKLHLSNDYQLITRTYDGSVRGVFASRSPHRPSAIGITTVKLLERENGKLRVKGLDAIDGTPVLDLKPYAKIMDEKKNIDFKSSHKKKNPRWELAPLIRNEKLEALLLKAGELHGHYCPGLAMGVMAGTYLLNELRAQTSEGMEKLLIIVETNSCFTDGLQYVTGCTFGNNGLIYRDYGKIAATLTKRGEKNRGLHAVLKTQSNEYLRQVNPKFVELFDRVIKQREGTNKDKQLFKKESTNTSFALLSIPFEELFSIQEVTPTLPPYAPIMESIQCENCGEKVMSSKTIQQNNQKLCIPCANAPHKELTGFGIEDKELTI